MSFRIPDFYKMPEMTVEQAKWVFGGEMLRGMEALDLHWERYCRGELDMLYADDDAFYEHWQSEVNAYNVVYHAMKPLFVKENK